MDLTSQDAETSTYNPSKAESKYLDRRKECHRKNSFTDESILYIQGRILENWSPDQIAHRKPNATIRIPSVSTIYRYIHLGKIRNISMRFLRRKGTFKRPGEKRGKFNDKGRTIRKRDKNVYNRLEIGHWEGDTVESGRNDHKRKSKYCFVTLVERKTRFAIAVLVPTKTSVDVTAAIINALKDFPSDMVKTITFALKRLRYFTALARWIIMKRSRIKKVIK